MKKTKKGYVLLAFLLSVSLGLGQTYHSITMDGSNDFAANYEEFPTSTPDCKAYCSWDAHNLYLGIFNPKLKRQQEDATIVENQNMFWYIDTDPQPDPKSGNGTDNAITVQVAITEVYDEYPPPKPEPFYTLASAQSWVLPFNADYCVNMVSPAMSDSNAMFMDFIDTTGLWGPYRHLKLPFYRQDSTSGFAEITVPWDSIGNPSQINILGFTLSGEWMSDLYDIVMFNGRIYSAKRDIGGTYASWPPGSLDGGDGDKKRDGSFSQWFQYDLASGINPNEPQYFASDGVAVNAKVFLEGPYSNGLMNTALRDNGYLPLTQPYNTEPWNYPGTESVVSIPPGVVDWVLLELRTSPEASGLVAARAAFLTSGGRIVDLDGQFPVAFESLPENYYLVIRHRNHLPIMSANLMALGHLSVLYDFSASLSQAFGINPMIELTGGIYGSAAGDGNASGGIYLEDYSLYKTNQGMEGYNPVDYNLSGGVYLEDYAIYRKNQGAESTVP